MNYNSYVEDIKTKTQFNLTENTCIHKKYEIIIPIYNGLSSIQFCIDSLIKYTDSCHSIYLYNDASSDISIKPWLNSLVKQHSHIHVIHQDTNLGYLKNINCALSKITKDVIILNSDTQVTKNWLTEISIIAQEPNIAIVCPLSDNATILSLDHEVLLTIEHLKYFSGQWYPIPTAVGSCMLIKQHIIEDFGLFDEYYDPGYGEECDYSLRLRQEGLVIACAPASFVYHTGSVSFSDHADLLKKQHQKLLDLRWPYYNKEIQEFAENNPIRQVEEYLFMLPFKNKKHVLHVVHGLDDRGGIELFTKELLKKTQDNIFNTVLVPNSNKAPFQSVVIKSSSSRVRIIYYQYINQKVYSKINNRNADLNHEKLDIMFMQQILNGCFKLIHFHSFVGIGSLIWPLICHRQGVPYIVSCHDHFSICFNFSLLKNKHTEFCGKPSSSENDKECVNCLTQTTNYNSLSTESYIEQRNSIWNKIISNSSEVLVPSLYLYDAMLENFKSLNPEKIHQIEPYFYPAESITQQKTYNERVCIAFLGTFSFEKGAHVFLDAYQLLKTLEIDWLIIGEINPFYYKQLKKTSIKSTGAYNREDLTNLLSKVDLVIIPTIQPETYCITLTEAWLNNIPVIASDIGALKNRINPGTNGELFPTADPETLATCIKNLVQSKEKLLRLTNNLKDSKRPTNDSLEKINHIYNSHLSNQIPLPSIQKNSGNQLNLPEDSSYKMMEKWLYSEMTLEAESDWKIAKEIDIIILGSNLERCLISQKNCQMYAPNCRIYIPLINGDFDIEKFKSTSCLLLEGQLINDNFGNWIDSFQSSQKSIGLADYALVNKFNEPYAPQFQAKFNVSSHLRNKQRIGAMLCKLPSGDDRFKEKLTKVISEFKIFKMIESIIYHKMLDKVHYFPHLSYLYSDISWVKSWKSELLDASLNTPLLNQSEQNISIVFLTNQNKNHIQTQIVNLRRQRQIKLNHIYVFTSNYLILNQDDVSAHYIDFKQADIFMNPVIKRDRAKQLLFINDNINLKNKNSLRNLSSYIGWHGIQAISPIFNSNHSSEYIVSEKIGKGHISGKGTIRNTKFDVGNPPIITELLDDDCFLISKTSWQEVGGFSPAGNIYYRSNTLSNQLCKFHHTIALLQITGISRTSLPSYCSDTTHVSLSHQRAELINQNKNFYTNSTYLSKAFDSQEGIQLDNNFGTFKTPKNLPRVIAYANDSWASGFYRVKAPLSAMAAANKISSHFLPERRQKKTASYFEINKQSPNVLLLHNFLDNQQLSALKLYEKYLDIPLILSLDDLLTDIPSYNPFSKSNPTDIQQRIQSALKCVDRLIVTTEYLANKFSHLHNDIKIINNLLPKELWMNPPVKKNKGKKLRIGWAGAAQHEKDLSWLNPVISGTSNHVQWVFYGYLPSGLDSNLIEFHNNTPLANYHSTLGALQLDIAIAPLVNNPFNYAKSNLKLLEYGALGLATICSAVENYKNSPALQLNNDPELWITSIIELVNNDEKRLELGANMRDWVSQNYFLEDNLHQWMDALFIEVP